MVGGILRWFVTRVTRKDEERQKTTVNNGILFCSGMIAGEGLVGILMALLAVFGVDKVLNLFYECGGTYLYKEVPHNTEQDEIRKMFSDGRAAMATLRLIAVEQPDVRNMEQMYGIVPMPKYDANQAEYGTLMHDQFTVFCIPASAAAEKIEMIGATMEVMASESLRLVKPAYYEIALKRKYMSDPVAWDMLDLTFARVIVDAGVVYGEALGYPHHHLRSIIQGKNNTVASKYGKIKPKMTKQLLKLTAKLDKLE
jgi:hypothetical protein